MPSDADMSSPHGVILVSRHDVAFLLFEDPADPNGDTARLSRFRCPAVTILGVPPLYLAPL